MRDNTGNEVVERVPGDGREHPVHEATVIHVPGDWYGPPLWGYQCSCGEREMRHQSEDFAFDRAEQHGAHVVRVHKHPPHPDFDPARERVATAPLRISYDWPRIIAVSLAVVGVIAWGVGRVI